MPMKYLFIHINKTGGTSISKALGMPFLHFTAKEFIAAHGQAVFDALFKFTVVRNPWDKVVSHYHYRVMTNQTSLGTDKMSFNSWVQKAYLDKDPLLYDIPKMFMPQCDWITDDSGKIVIDSIARYENLNDDFQKLCKILGKKLVLPHLKASTRGDYREYYNENSVRIIGDAFAVDIEQFGYTFN